MNQQEALIRGLELQGWYKTQIGKSRQTHYQGFAHPQRGARMLWVSESGALRVGHNASSSEPVQPMFRERAIAKGKQS